MDQNITPQIAQGFPMINGEVIKLTNNGRLLPYIADTVYCNFGKNYFTTFAEMWMDKKYESSTEIHHIEEGMQLYIIKATADATAPAAGAQVSFNYSANVIGNYAAVQKGFFVVIPPNGKMAKVVDVNPTTKTVIIEPNDKNYKINIKAGNELIIAPAAIRASCECFNFQSGKKIPGLSYKSKMMIIETGKTICGEDLAQWLESRTLYPMKSIETCEDVQVWWHEDLNQMWFEFMQAKQIYAMFGDDITQDTSLNFTNLKSTTGVYHILRARATQIPVPATVGITIDWFKRMSLRLKGIRKYCDQYSLWMGKNHRSQADTALEALVTKQDLSWNFLDNDKERGIRLGFDAVKVDGIEWYLHDEDSLNDPGFLGADGFNGPDTTFGVPLCRMPCGNESVTPLRINYLAGNGINRELVENDYGVLRPGSKDSNCDRHTWSLMSQFGIDAYCMNNWIFTESL